MPLSEMIEALKSLSEDGVPKGAPVHSISLKWEGGKPALFVVHVQCRHRKREYCWTLDN